jgi:hypothetical protein
MTFVFFAVAALIVAALCVAAVQDYNRFVFLGAFILPLHAIAIDIGVLLTLDKCFALIGFILFAARPMPARREWLTAFWLMIGYMTALTLIIFSTGAIDSSIRYAHGMGWGPAQSTFRLPVQLVTQIAIWLFLPIGYSLGRGAQAVSGFLWGTLCNAGLGIYQVIAAVKGLPWLPPEVLTRLSGSGGGQFQIQHSDLYRLSGLAGEPKHAAAGFVFAIVLLLCLPIAGKEWKIAVLGVALLLTMSTSGWAAFALIYLVYLISRRKYFQLSLAALLVFFVLMATQLSNTVAFVVQTRIVERAADPEHFEPKDAAIFDIAKHNPQVLLTGAGAGGSDFFVMRSIKTSMLELNGTVSPTYLLTGTIGDYGILGVCLLGMLLISMAPNFPGNSCRLYILSIIAMLTLPRFAVEGSILFVLGSLMRALYELRESVLAPAELEQGFNAANMKEAGTASLHSAGE